MNATSRSCPSASSTTVCMQKHGSSPAPTRPDSRARVMHAGCLRLPFRPISSRRSPLSDRSSPLQSSNAMRDAKLGGVSVASEECAGAGIDLGDKVRRGCGPVLAQHGLLQASRQRQSAGPGRVVTQPEEHELDGCVGGDEGVHLAANAMVVVLIDGITEAMAGNVRTRAAGRQRRR